MKRYLKVWKQLMHCAFLSYNARKINSISFMLAKLLRFGFFWLMIVSIFNFTTSFGGFTRYQALLLFLTYNFIDVVTQGLFRGIYVFANEINRGNFDFALVRPIHPLFFSLVRLTDILDFFFLVPIGALLVYVIIKLWVGVTIASLIAFILFVALSLILSLSLHILSATLTLWTIQGDIIWFYRRALIIGSFPPDILPSAAQAFFTYVLPIIVIMVFPVRALLQTLPLYDIAVGLSITIIFLAVSLLAWKRSVRYYSSASS